VNATKLAKICRHPPPPPNGIQTARRAWMLAHEHSMVHKSFCRDCHDSRFLAPVGRPNINNVTCLLTLPIALWRSQYQVMAGPLQGSRRSSNTHHCHHHNQVHHHCLHCLPPQRCQKQKIFVEIIVHECNRNHPRSCLQIFTHTTRGSGGENL
jgi:hypothetical protein